MLNRIVAVVALSAVAVLAQASERDARSEAKEVIEAKDGGTLYVFDNGKMAYANKSGQAINMKNVGPVVTAKDGRKIKVVGDEWARLDSLLRKKEE
jgi:predicted lipoprotein with Yx(FWY)xxD motif